MQKCKLKFNSHQRATADDRANINPTTNQLTRCTTKEVQ